MKTLTFSKGALRTNTYFCFDDAGNCVVIDPGMDGEAIYQKLSEKDLSPQWILLTHGHFDHSQGAKFLAEKTGAKIAIHREDAAMLERPEWNSANFYYRGDFSFYPRTKADLLLEEGSELRCGDLSFSVLHTPGHTPGSVIFRQQNTLFCGDTVFAYGYGRYDLWGGSRTALAASLERLAHLEGNFKLCPGHGNTATLERVRDMVLGYVSELGGSQPG